MDAVGRLAGGAAHDLNNILGAIEGYATLMQNSLPPGDAARQDLDEIRKAVAKAAGLTKTFFIFSLKNPTQRAAASLRAAAEKLRGREADLAALGIKLELDLPPGPQDVLGDAVRLDLLLEHLFSNARDAMPGGGTLTIAASRVELAPEEVRAADPARAGKCFYRLSVRDTGTGISPEDLPNIFDPFFTTKEKGKGTGLGLAVVYGVARQSNGWVEAESEPGRGSEFRVFLPAAPGPAGT
jgi:signal transduction histidine kinase